MLSSKFFSLVVGITLILSQSMPVYAGTTLNKINILADKLASNSKADVVKGSGTQVYITIGQNDGVTPGNKFEIVRLGNALKIGNEIIGYEETPVAEVEVTRAREKLSICKVLNKTDIPKVGDRAYQLRKTINTLVVGQFSYNQSFNRLTKSLQEKLVTTMAGKGMQVVERDQLERVLKEQKLGYTGLINTSSAKKIGQLLGADGMMLGTVNDMGNSITINARLVDMETGKTVSAGEVEMAKTPLIAQLLDIPVEDKLFTQPSSGMGRDGNTKKKKNDSEKVVDIGGVSVKLIGCNKSGTTVECNMFVTNNEEDTYLGLDSRDSRLFDHNGNVYIAERMRLGNKKGSYESIDMVRGIPVKAGMTFTKVLSESEGISLIEFDFNRYGKAQFRDVSFSE